MDNGKCGDYDPVMFTCPPTPPVFLLFMTRFTPQVDRLSEIFEALDTDESGEAVHYSALFADDDVDMNQGMTAETIRGQHLQERLEFMQVR